MVRREHAARGLHRGAQLVVGDRVRELLEGGAELVGATVEERQLEVREQRADIGWREVEHLADGDAREILITARHQQIDAVVPERPALERAGDGELGIEVARGLLDVTGRARDPAEAAQRRGGARICDQRGVVVGARTLGVL